MKENNISRRRMIKIGSVTALSTLVSPSFVAAKTSFSTSEKYNFKIPGSDSDVCYMKAVEMAALLRTKKISAREVMQAHLKQIAKVNSKVNAIVTLVPEDQLMVQALAADESLAKGNLTGTLHGLPIAVKDLIETKGIRTTYGSSIWKDFIPSQDALLVERQKRAGAIVIGKTNVPE